MPTKKKRKIDDGSPPQTDATPKKRKTVKPESTQNNPTVALDNLFKIQLLSDRLKHLKKQPDDLLQKMYEYLHTNLEIPRRITITCHQNRPIPDTIVCLMCTSGSRPFAHGVAYRWTGMNLLNLISQFSHLYHSKDPKVYNQIQILNWIITFQSDNAYSYVTNAVIRNYQSSHDLDTEVNTLNNKYKSNQLSQSDPALKIINLFTHNRPRESYRHMIEGLNVDNNALFTDALERAFIDPPYLRFPITKVSAYTAQFISTVFLSEPARVPLVHVTNMFTIDVMENCYKSKYNLQQLTGKKKYNQEFISRLFHNPMAFTGSMYYSNTLAVQVNTLARAYEIFKEWKKCRFPTILRKLKPKRITGQTLMEEYIREITGGHVPFQRNIDSIIQQIRNRLQL